MPPGRRCQESLRLGDAVSPLSRQVGGRRGERGWPNEGIR